jgi:hypothetical protein
MNRQLIVNGKLMELSGDTKIGVTYQANNIAELQNRQGTYTNTFKLRRTSVNVANLEWSHVLTSASLIPYRKLKATYIENGIEIISEGDAQITQIDQDFIHINVVSGNIDLVDAMGDVTVGDLYLDDTAFTWDTNSVVISRDRSQYYIFPFIDWRSDSDTFFNSSTVSVPDMLPAAPMPKLFERLETYTGLTFKGSYIDSTDHQNQILTPDNFTINPLYLPQDVTKANLVYGNYVAYADGYFFGSFDLAEGSGTNYNRVYPFQNTFDPLFSINIYEPDVTHVGSLKLNSLLNVKWSRDENYGLLEYHYDRDFYIVTRIIRVSDGQVLAEVTSEVWTGKVTSEWIQFSIAVETGNITLTAGEGYYCAHDFVSAAHPNINTTIYVRAFTSVFTHTPTDILSPGSPLRFPDLFRMKVKDVMKDILNLRGVIIQTNSYTKEVQFNYFQNIVENIPIAKDWSAKVDRRSTLMTFKFGDYAQKNWFRFKSSDTIPDQLGDYYFEIDDETLDKEKTVVQLGHTATEQTNKYLGYNIPKIDAIDSDVKWQKPTYRILQLETQNTSFNITVDDTISSDTISDSIPFCRFVGFEILVPQYYDALAGILDQTKAIKLPLKLTAIDIQELDFTIPIFLNIPELNINSYFYLNKVENYKGELTACEFIRL